MSVMAGFMRDLYLAPESEEITPEGVERGQPRSKHAAGENNEVERAMRMPFAAGSQGRSQDLVFAPEAGKERKRGKSKSPAQERPVGDRHHFTQAADAAHIDHATHRMHDAAGTQEE